MDLPHVAIMSTQIWHIRFSPKNTLKFLLTHGNISFILIIDQKNCMVIASDNTHIVNQKMKLYFVDFFISSTIHVVCDYGCMQLDFADWYDFTHICHSRLKSSCKHQSQNPKFLLVIVSKMTHLQDLNGRVIN